MKFTQPFFLLALLLVFACSSENETSNDIPPTADGNYSLSLITKNAEFPARTLHTSVVFDNKIWVIGGVSNPGGTYNDVWYSENGKDWLLATGNAGFSPRIEHTSVVFDNKIWVIGGASDFGTVFKNDVWYSDDGINWIEATSEANFLPRTGHSSFVWDGKIWVLGGNALGNNPLGFRDAWSSNDGINWTNTTDDGVFGRIFNHSSLVFNNKIWTIAGNIWPDGILSSRRINSIWSSLNGADWLTENNQNFPERSSHASVVYDNKIWVIGGFGLSGVLNDFMYTTNGNSWLETENTLELPAIVDHTSVVFQDKIWVIGGGNLQLGFSNSIWALEKTSN